MLKSALATGAVQPESKLRYMSWRVKMIAVAGVVAILCIVTSSMARAHMPSPTLQIKRQAPSDDEVRARTLALLANQHNDDASLEQYERVERHVDQTGGAAPRIVDDKTIRVIPNGAGTSKILLRYNGKDSDPASLQHQLLDFQQVLEMVLDSNNSRGKSAIAKYQKRAKERAELVDAVKDAFISKWLGTEMRAGRDCDVIQADPNPAFHPRTIFQDAMLHVSAKVWLDHDSNQIVHVEAQVLSDIPFGGGVLGKLYKGGTFSLDQAEIAPGVWFPTRYQYDFSGRKFLFPFEEHQFIESSHYRRVGTPRETLAMIKSELANPSSAAGDP